MKKPWVPHDLSIFAGLANNPVGNILQGYANLILTGGFIIFGLLLRRLNPALTEYTAAFIAWIAQGGHTIHFAKIQVRSLTDMHCRNMPSIPCRI